MAEKTSSVKNIDGVKNLEGVRKNLEGIKFKQRNIPRLDHRVVIVLGSKSQQDTVSFDYKGNFQIGNDIFWADSTLSKSICDMMQSKNCFCYYYLD